MPWMCMRKNDHKRKKSDEIDKKIVKWMKNYKKYIKILLLGTGESGKTTILKQMKILHIEGFTEEERNEKVHEIRRNILETIKELTGTMKYLKPPVLLANQENEESLAYIKAFDIFDETREFDDEFYQHVKNLWSDKGIQECFHRSTNILIDSAKYFLDRVDKISRADYIPSDNDILRCRKRTTDVQKIEFEVKIPRKYGGGVQCFWMFDVGGQRGERRKWIQVFDGITAVLFLVACSEFDSKLREDNTTNRLQESIKLFEEVWMSRFLRDSGFILFLNKQDILEEKIRNGHRIVGYFPEYDKYTYNGDSYININSKLKFRSLTTASFLTSSNRSSISSASTNSLSTSQTSQLTETLRLYEYHKTRAFIRDKFLEITKKSHEHRRFSTNEYNNESYLIKHKKRDCFWHYTTATDTNNIKTVFEDVHTMIIMWNLSKITSF